jgi:hypothetical protein
MVSLQTHPFPALRAHSWISRARSEEYRRLLRGDYPRTNTEAGKRVCSACRTTVTNVTFQFCPECGAPLPPVATT